MTFLLPWINYCRNYVLCESCPKHYVVRTAPRKKLSVTRVALYQHSIGTLANAIGQRDNTMDHFSALRDLLSLPRPITGPLSSVGRALGF
jgi:hypothetical protein